MAANASARKSISKLAYRFLLWCFALSLKTCSHYWRRNWYSMLFDRQRDDISVVSRSALPGASRSRYWTTDPVGAVQLEKKIFCEAVVLKSLVEKSVRLCFEHPVMKVSPR